MAHFNNAQDLKDAFNEALICTICKITDLSKITYHKHRELGYYNPLRDPPFPLPLHKYDIEVDPLFSNNIDDQDNSAGRDGVSGTDSDTDTDTDTDSDTDPYTTPKAYGCSYNDIMTPRQRIFYHSLIDDYRTVDPTRDLLFARYCVDYHIHLHYLAARGMLNLCRNVEEMHEFRRWRWELSIIYDPVSSPSSSSAAASAAASMSPSQAASSNGVTPSASDSGIGSASSMTFSTIPPSSTTSSNAHSDSDTTGKETWQQAQNRYRHRRLRRWGWPDDIGFFMLYQTTLWRQAWAARRDRVADARAKWSIIAEERWRQRRWGEWKNYWRRRDVRVGAYVYASESEGESEGDEQGEVFGSEEGSEDGSFSGSTFGY